MTPDTRNTIALERAEVLDQQHLPGAQHILRIRAPRIAQDAAPGMFAHIRCHSALPMRRPLSILRTSPEHGWVEFLYKSIGTGTHHLARQRTGEELSVLGPIGTPFSPQNERSRPLLLGGGVGIPPMVFLAQRLAQADNWKPLVLIGSEVPFPFEQQISSFLVGGIPEGVVASMPLLEEWGVPSRLASLQGFADCFQGYVTELAELWLQGLDDEQRNQVEIFACGPTPMLRAAAALAARHDLPCQVCLEEYMACGVGGCAGCAVRLREDGRDIMRRVCVDGPVFDARKVYWDETS